MGSLSFNRNGGLTVVPLLDHEQNAEAIKKMIDSMHLSDAIHGEGNTVVDIATPHFGTRANGEPFIRLGKQHVGAHDCYIITSGPGTPENILRLLLTLSQLRGRKASRISVITGYMPLCRSDKDEGSDELTLFSFLVQQILAAAGEKLLHRILAVDLHSEQLSGFAYPGLITGVTFMQQILQQALADAQQMGLPVVLMFPDDGARKRYETIAFGVMEKLGVPPRCVYGSKRRQSSTKCQLVGVHGDTEAVAGSVVITVDDEIATGGTNIATALMLHDQHKPREVWAVVTHGIMCGGAVSLFSANDCPISRVYMSDTVPTPDSFAPLIENGRFRIVSWLTHLAQIIYFDHWDRSIRELR